MKILSVDKIREADAFTIKNEPISSVDLMERAAYQLYKWIKKRVDTPHPVQIFVGVGNNGGDGLALARLLTINGYKVNLYIVHYSGNFSPDFQTNENRLLEMGLSENIFHIKTKEDLPAIGDEDIVVDALFGSGLSRSIIGLAADVIEKINSSTAVTIAVDIPSGLFADQHSDEKKGAIIRADYTLSFQMPKLAFLLPENDQFVGKWFILDIGLSSEYINTASSQYFYMRKRDVAAMHKPRRKFSHKGTFGHALLIAGSYGKMGAASLAARACLRSGVGLLHVHIPSGANTIMQTAAPECMISIDESEYFYTSPPDLNPYNAIGIGPGLGTEKQTTLALKALIQNSPCPIVFDADALNILSENKTWLAFLPKRCILTPHPKEFERLAGKWSNDFEKLELLKQFSQRYNAYVVLKGAHTAVCFPDGNIYFNSNGNPGMATAGSGDVLTGIILGLMAQSYTPGQAAVIGVYLHGLAGDLAAKELGYEALIASDIVGHLGKAYKRIC